MGHQIKTTLTGNELVHIHFDSAEAPKLTSLQNIANLAAGAAHNDGDILYVSKYGDNGTAVKGDPLKAWADPWTAIGAAVSGDRIHVFSGTWTFAETGFGADYEEADNQNFTNLYKNGVSWYFEPGAKLHWIDTGQDSPRVFQVTDIGGVLDVKGHLQFETDNTQWGALIETREDCIVDFEFDELILEGYYAVLKYLDYGVTSDCAERISIKGNRIINNNGIEFDFGDRAGKAREGVAYVDIDYVECNNQFSLYAEGNYEVVGNIGKIYGYFIGGSGDSDSTYNIGQIITEVNPSPIEVYSHEPLTKNRVLTCTVGSVVKRVASQASGSALFARVGGRSIGAETFKSHIKVHVDSATFIGALAAADSASNGAGVTIAGTDDNMLVEISGNYYSPEGGHVRIGVNSGTETVVGSEFLVDLSKMKLVKTGTNITNSVINDINTNPAVPVLCEGFMSNEAIGVNITKIGTELINAAIY